ncbi:unannotated protein [freshwater metagenome]|uniref:Unannotated protein n=1 Tax=freshwater metagenome TaxID=449393 RepID=A0A6J6WRH0_9ZZZZ
MPRVPARIRRDAPGGGATPTHSNRVQFPGSVREPNSRAAEVNGRRVARTGRRRCGHRDVVVLTCAEARDEDRERGRRAADLVTSLPARGSDVVVGERSAAARPPARLNGVSPVSVPLWVEGAVG